jgi:hypothetical protein
VKRIDVLPDDVLLEIFDFYTKMDGEGEKVRADAWQLLVHVCGQWRNLVFGSPRRLNLRLYCTPKTPVRDTLDVWPALPLVIDGNMALSSGTDDIIAALGQSNRVCQVYLRGLATRQLEDVLAPMQASFPELTDLQLTFDGEKVPVIPDSFLDGSASLRTLDLTGISFPGVPRLLLSGTHLVYLRLFNIPHSGYISPDAMVALLCALSSLKTLYLGFQSPRSFPDSETRRRPPPKSSILPSLDKFRFKGVTEYLEDLVTSIDTPLLDDMDITLFNQIDFDCPRLARFINRTSTLRADEAHVKFDDSTARVRLRSSTSGYPTLLQITISCREPDWQLSSIEQVCDASLHPLSTVENLYIEHEYSELVWKDDAVVDTLWSELLLPFTAVKNLYLSKDFAPGIAAALQELIGSRIMEALPSLQNIFVEALEPSGPFQKNIEQFSATRQLSNHPISISDWPKEESVDDTINRQLNIEDALSYLDAVKVQFQDRRDVYNVFLDTVREFRSQEYVYSRPHDLSPLVLRQLTSARIIYAADFSLFLSHSS